MVGVGLRGLGHRLLLPAVRRFYGGYPCYYPLLPDLRLRRLVQPVDRRLRPRRRGVRSVRRRRRRRALQPADRHLLARRRGVRARTARAASARPTTRAPAPTARRARARTSTAAGADRACSAATSGRSTVARHQPRHRHHDARDAGQRRRRGGHAQRGPGGDGGVARTGSGDVYAGRDGNVYRNEGGGWQKYDNGTWDSRGADSRAGPPADASTSSASRGDLAGSGGSWDPPPGTSSTATRGRGEGSQRTRDYGSYQRQRRRPQQREHVPPELGGSRGERGGMRGGGGGAAAAGGGRRRLGREGADLDDRRTDAARRGPRGPGARGRSGGRT